MTTGISQGTNPNAKFKREIPLPLNIQLTHCEYEAGFHSVERKQGAFVACSVHLPQWRVSKNLLTQGLSFIFTDILPP